MVNGPISTYNTCASIILNLVKQYTFWSFIVPRIDTFVYLDTRLMKPFLMFQFYYSSFTRVEKIH